MCVCVNVAVSFTEYIKCYYVCVCAAVFWSTKYSTIRFSIIVSFAAFICAKCDRCGLQFVLFANNFLFAIHFFHSSYCFCCIFSVIQLLWPLKFIIETHSTTHSNLLALDLLFLSLSIGGDDDDLRKISHVHRKKRYEAQRILLGIFFSFGRSFVCLLIFSVRENKVQEECMEIKQNSLTQHTAQSTNEEQESRIKRAHTQTLTA